LLLDEPFGALDARVRKELRGGQRRLHDETHTTTVIVTHDQEEAMDVADRVVVMNGGRPTESPRSRRCGGSSISGSRCPSSSFVTREVLSAQLTREQVEALELQRGQIVYVRPTRQTVFAD
jgi:ABC-type proline/glycine betaine transport system ATPase subunit